MGHLTAEQAGRIQNAIVDRWYRDQAQRQAGREREAVRGLMMLGGGT